MKATTWDVMSPKQKCEQVKCWEMTLKIGFNPSIPENALKEFPNIYGSMQKSDND